MNAKNAKTTEIDRASAPRRTVSDLPIRSGRDRAVVGGAAPKLYEAACKGTHLPEVVIELWR